MSKLKVYTSKASFSLLYRALLLFHKKPGAVYTNKDKEQNSQGGSCKTEEETEALLDGESGILHSQRNHYGSGERERDLHELSSPEPSSGNTVEEKPQ